MMLNTKEIATQILPFLRVYKDGTVERLVSSPFVPSSLNDPTTNVSSKDITISPEVSARLYLPPLTTILHNQKLPILVYFHGGGFCIGSAFSVLSHRHTNFLVLQAKVLAISVEYRLAPEHPLPIAFEDSWAALQWVASNSIKDKTNKELWLSNHGDFERVYVGGDSAGANIAHHMALRTGLEGLFGGVKILGALLCYPFLWGSEPIGAESRVDREQCLFHRAWLLAYPSAPGGIDNPSINPFIGNAPRLSELKCSRLLVCVAAKDELRERGVRYCDAVRESGWGGEMEFYEVEGEDHCFHIINPETDRAKSMFICLASFLV